MSVDLVNASHFGVHDASLQGFSVWTEEMPGLASNWQLVMVPNLHGISDNRKLFNDVTIKLCQGSAISWDGQVIMHCTSLSNYLDGPKGNIFDKEQVTICTVHSQWQRNAMLVPRRRFLQEPWDLMPVLIR